MCGNWKSDDEGLKKYGLVVWSGKEEVRFSRENRSCYKWYNGGICDVKCGVDCKNVGGVSLQTGHWA